MRALVYLFAYLLIFISGLPVSLQTCHSSDSCSIHNSNDVQAERLGAHAQKILAKQGESEAEWCDTLPSTQIVPDYFFQTGNLNIPRKFIFLSLHVQDHLCPRAPPNLIIV